MRTLFLFIKWIGVSLFNKLASANGNLREGLEYSTGETLALWFLTAGVSTVANLLLVGLFAVAANTHPSGWAVIWLPIALFVHLVYTAISVMFKCFKQERSELFETIKNGK